MIKFRPHKRGKMSTPEHFSKAAWLYKGKVMHARISPKHHRFEYHVFSMVVDLDRLNEIDRISPIFSVGKFNLLSFEPRDHHPDGTQNNEGVPLRQLIGAHLKAHHIEWTPSRILLACYPRILGKVFNPLSVFYIYRSDHQLGALIYEVRNTFGEKHLYVCPVNNDQRSAAHIRQDAAKDFYVSPFIEMNMHYHFTMSEPNETISWRILEKQHDKPVLAATYYGYHALFSTKNLIKFFLQIPLLTWKILIGIHFEALRLWLKGLKYVPRRGNVKGVKHKI